MRETDSGLRSMTALATALLSLTACAGPVTTDRPVPQAQAPAESQLQRAVRDLLANQAEARLGSVAGAAFVTAPIAVFLAESQVSLIPNAPELEAALAPLQHRWRKGRRRPLSFQEFQGAFARLTVQRVAIGRLGGEGLIRFANTDDRGRFLFEGVPAGKWMLVANMNSPISVLLWAVPVEVAPGSSAQIFLVESNLLLEAMTESRVTP